MANCCRKKDVCGNRTPRGSRWSDVAVSRMIARLELNPATA